MTYTEERNDDEAVEDCDDNSADDVIAADVKKAAKGTHVWHSHEYAVFTNNRNFSDCKVNLRAPLCVPKLLGVVEKSKAITVLRHDSDREDPSVTIILLRAWVIWRMRRARGFVGGHPARGKFVAREIAALRKLVAGLGNDGRTGSSDGDRQLAEWCPDVLPG